MKRKQQKTKQRESGKAAFPFPQSPLFWLPVLLMVWFFWMSGSRVNVMNPDAGDLLDWGANLRTAVFQGDYWRLLTYILPHAGWMHLLLNCTALLALGVILDKQLSFSKQLTILLLSTFFAGVASLIRYPWTVSVGASGILFGFAPFIIQAWFKGEITASSRKWYLIYFAILVLDVIYGFVTPHVNVAAHVGGFLCGGILWLLFTFVQAKYLPYQTLGIGGGLGVVLVFWLSSVLPDPIGDYTKAYDRFLKEENLAMEAFDLPDTGKQELMVETFEAKAKNWENAIIMFDSLAVSEMPRPLQNRINDLKEYCKMRKYQFELVGLYYRTWDDGFFDAAEEEAAKIQTVLTRIREKKPGKKPGPFDRQMPAY